MRRFSIKIAENRWNKSGKWHTGQWLESSDYEAKDKRSKFVTKADQNRAKKTFMANVRAEMERHPNMSQREAMDKVLHSSIFTTRKEIEQENIAKTARKYNIKVNKNYLEKKNSSDWLITKGPHAGHTLSMIHIPGGYPSYQMIII